jgi:hypothetical protein
MTQPSWESAPLPPGLPPGHEPDEQGGGGGPAAGPLVPWEDPAAGGEIERFVATVKGVLLEPVDTFDRVGRSESLGRAIGFGMIITTIAQAATATYQLTIGSVNTLISTLSSHGTGPRPSPYGGLSEAAVQIGLTVMMPLLYPISLVISAGIVHVGLMIFGGAKGSFNQTMRALCYSSGPQLLALVPFVGSIFAGLWMLVLEIIAIARVHRTGYGQAAAAILAPALLVCVCIGGAFVVLGAALFAALKP